MNVCYLYVYTKTCMDKNLKVNLKLHRRLKDWLF
jgi:hypothetical protein